MSAEQAGPLDIRWTLSQEAHGGAMTGAKGHLAGLFYLDRKLEGQSSSVASDSPHLALVNESSVLYLALPSWVQRLGTVPGLQK